MENWFSFYIKSPIEVSEDNLPLFCPLQLRKTKNTQIQEKSRT